MAVDSNSHEFTIHVVGEKTKHTYRGKFRAKLRLTHRDEIYMDQRRRQLLGEKPEFATPRVLNQCAVFSELEVRIIDAPDWWKDAAGGLDLPEDAPVREVYDEIDRSVKKLDEVVLKEAEDSAKTLKEAEIEPEEE